MRTKNKKKLSRERRKILELHRDDILKLLIKQLLAVDSESEVSGQRQTKLFAMLSEYFRTRALLIVE